MITSTIIATTKVANRSDKSNLELETFAMVLAWMAFTSRKIANRPIPNPPKRECSSFPIR